MLVRYSLIQCRAHSEDLARVWTLVFDAPPATKNVAEDVAKNIIDVAKVRQGHHHRPQTRPPHQNGHRWPAFQDLLKLHRLLDFFESILR